MTDCNKKFTKERFGFTMNEKIVFNCGFLTVRGTDFDCKNGFILDGYPRNLSQAKFLEDITDIDLALMIDLSEEKIIARLSSRRMCSKCAQPTALEWMVDGKCEKCGGEVYVRDDDKPEVIKNRLQKQAVSQELIEFYKEKGVFNKIDATDEVEMTYSLVKEVLDKVNND